MMNGPASRDVQAIVQARVTCLFDNPEVGEKLTRLVMVRTVGLSEGVRCDSECLEYDPEFVESLTPDELVERLTLAVT